MVGAPRSREGFRVGSVAALGAAAVIAAVAWIVLSGPPGGPAESATQERRDARAAPEAPRPGELAGRGDVPLPGRGDLLVELVELGGREDTRVRPARPGRLAGIVRGPDGEPVPDARVLIVGGPQGGVSTRSGPDGAYVLADLIPGSHFVAVESGAGPRIVRMQRVRGSGTTKRDLMIGQGVAARFRVLDHESKPLEGARVLVDRGAIEATTNEDGVAALRNIPGGTRVLVDVRAEGYAPVRYEMNLFAQMNVAEPLELPPMPRGGTIRGWVKSWPGGPAPTVTLVPRASGPGPYTIAWELFRDVPVGRDGYFELHDVPATHMVDVRVFHPSGVADPEVRTLKPTAGSTATCHFVVKSSDARVGGEVLDEQGEAVPGATVVLEAVQPDRVLGRLYPGLDRSPVAVTLPTPGALRREVVTGSSGEFRFTVGDHPQGTGHMLLRVEKDGYRTARREIKVVGENLVVRLQPERRDASLQVVRSDGGPLPQVRWRLGGDVVPEADGPRLGGLVEGYYEVRIRRGDDLIWSRDAYWVEGRTEIDLAP